MMAEILSDTPTNFRAKYFRETVDCTENTGLIYTRAMHGETIGEAESSQQHANMLKAAIDWFAAHGITPTP